MSVPLERPVVEEVRAALADGMTLTQAAQRFGIHRTTVNSIAQGRLTGRPVPPAVLAERWTAACMEPDEWADWQRLNRSIANHGDQASRPCSDCLLGFAADMRAEGRCNGQPAGDTHDHEEEEPVRIAPVPTEAQPFPESIVAAATAPPATHPPTAKQREAWEAYNRHGGQSAAARSLGKDQGAVRNGIEGYLRATGAWTGRIPPADPSLVAATNPSIQLLSVSLVDDTPDNRAAGAGHVVRVLDAEPSEPTDVAPPEPMSKETADSLATPAEPPASADPVDDEPESHDDAPGATPAGPDDIPVTAAPPEPGFLARIEQQIAFLDEEMEALNAARDHAQDRIARLLDAREVYRAVMAGRMP